jgi:hypothetical protein
MPRSVRVASVVPECAWSARRRFWIMSHQVQLSPAASHRPTAVLDPAGHATEPPACRSRCPYFPGQTCAGYCPTLEIRSERPSFTPRQRFPGDPGTGAAGPVRAVLPLSAGRPDSREEGSARTPRATCARRPRAEPSRQRSASKPHDRDRPARYPADTCHRPSVDRLRHQAQASPNDHAGASDSA